MKSLLLLALLLAALFLPAPPLRAAALAPNPSTGHVRVGYSLPHTAKAVEIKINLF